jgi:predicted alpha-1,2-mannosidase
VRTVLALVLLAASACHPAPSDDDPVVDSDDPSAAPIAAYDPLPLVDPFIATGGQGGEIAEVTPAAKFPLGMTSIGPDTRSTKFGQLAPMHYAGYWYPDDEIDNFSLTHHHGMGVVDFGTVPFMPRDGWDPSYTTVAGRKAPFTHDDEEATPGRYRVRLQDQDIDVEAVATLRGGQVRFTFPAGAEPVVLFDLAKVLPGASVAEAFADVDLAAGTVDGLHRVKGGYSGRFGGLMSHFSARFDPAPVGGGGWTDPAAPTADLTHVEGTTAGVWLEFPPGTTVVDMRIGLSYVDVDGAVANREADLPDTDLDARLAEAEDAWRSYLGRVRVRGGTDEERRVFHTALFHALFFPQRQDDVDGRYRGADQAIHTADGPHYSDLSLWDTFRTLHPWYVLAWPELQTDVNRSLVRMIEDGGHLPMWPLEHGNTGGMVGSPGIQVLSESWQKGLRDFDVETAYQASLDMSQGRADDERRGGIEHYLEKGWVPREVSDTLEYAWNDFALMRWAEGLGKPDVAQLATQADNWKEVWNPELGFNVGRNEDGSWWDADPADFDAFAWRKDYVEGDAWHYVWYAPFDVDAMIDVQHGGDVDAFRARTETFWENVYAEEDDLGPDDYYWHGNEPVMHYAFLGALAGFPETTADAARWILAHKYADSPTKGLDGNDDAGTLSAWYLCASTGLFPIAGTTTLTWSPALWERTEIDRGDGTTVVIRAPGADDAHRYLTSWSVGGEAIDGFTLDWADLIEGGEVEMTLSDRP